MTLSELREEAKREIMDLTEEELKTVIAILMTEEESKGGS